MDSDRRQALRIVVAVAIASFYAGVRGDSVKPHHPNIIERIVEPLVREVALSQLGGPAKRSFREDRSEVMNKVWHASFPFLVVLFVPAPSLLHC